MPRTPVQKLGIASGAISVAVAVGCTIFLVAGGAHAGAPFVFVVGAALALCAVLYLLARSAMSVMIEPQADEVRVATGRRRKELEREKQLLLKALKELAFDHEMHKISDVDYQEIAALYRARATRVMRQLDENDAADQKIAAADAARPTSPAARPAQAPARPGVRRDSPPAACAKCGTANEPDADFCNRCASPLGTVEASR